MRTALLAAAALLAAPAAAGAAGGPIAGNTDAGYEGAVVPGDPTRLVAATDMRGRTFVALVERRGGRLGQSLRLRGRFTVPGVDQNGTPDGRSADGRTAVLAETRFRYPWRRSRFTVLRLQPLRVSTRIALRGMFSFDALSPDGRRMYLIQYTDRKDPRRYVVRSYDLAARHLERGAIVDAREPDEQMRGYPLSRVTSADGRWAYTLYDGGHEPFIHALDTVRRRAFCIDLPMLAHAADPYSLRLGLGERGVSVLGGGRPLAVVNTRTMRASEPPVASRRPSPPKRPRPATAASAGGADWSLAAGLALFGIVAAAALRTLLRRRRRAYR
jgi:hypothetical protein